MYSHRYASGWGVDISCALPQGCGAQYGLVLSDAGIVAVGGARGAPSLHPSDLLLLATFVRANESLRQAYNSTPPPPTFWPHTTPHPRRVPLNEPEQYVFEPCASQMGH